MVELSVIIPTRGRRSSLEVCVGSLLRQSLPGEMYEIIVINDGQADAAAEDFMEKAAAHKNVVYVRQEQRGPAAARNRGIGLSRGGYLFFTGDDIIASYRLLEEHLRWLKKMPECGVVGFTPWDVSQDISGFMEFLLRKGHQFDYRGMRHGAQVLWEKFYTSNVSLGRQWFTGDRFDERFLYPAWEDLDLGYRLVKKGLKLFFNRNAVAYHRHQVNEDDFYRKAWQKGYSRICFLRKQGKQAALRLQEQRVRALLPVLVSLKAFGNCLPAPARWTMNIEYHSCQGMREALQKDSPAEFPDEAYSRP